MRECATFVVFENYFQCIDMTSTSSSGRRGCYNNSGKLLTFRTACLGPHTQAHTRVRLRGSGTADLFACPDRDRGKAGTVAPPRSLGCLHRSIWYSRSPKVGIRKIYAFCKASLGSRRESVSSKSARVGICIAGLRSITPSEALQASRISRRSWCWMYGT